MLAEFSFPEFWEQCKIFTWAIWDYVTTGWVLACLGLVVLLIILLIFLSKKQPSRIRAFNNNKGYVEISRAALIDIIRSTSEQVDIEKKPGVTVRTKRGKLHIDVKIRLLPSRRLTEVSDILQKHLTETLEQGLGIRRLGNINVVVVGVRVKTGKEARASLPLFTERPEKPEPEAPVEVVEESDPEPELLSGQDLHPEEEEPKREKPSS